MFYHRLFDSVRYTVFEDENSVNIEYRYYCDKFYDSMMNSFLFYLFSLAPDSFFPDIVSEIFPKICHAFTVYFGAISLVSFAKVLQIDHFRIASINFWRERKNHESLLSNVQLIVENNDFFKKKKNKFFKD